MSLTASIHKRLSPGFGLDLDISAGAGITMIFGASGSGKTTLLRCLAGLTRPDTGCITVGADVLFDSSRSRSVPVQRRRIGYVFQQLALFPHLSTGENIMYGVNALAPDLRRQRAGTVAESLHISQFLDRRPESLSGGERQRVALARSLVTEPSLLLLDEPLSALDHRTRSRITEDLRAWNAAHRIPILYVTHSHREVFALGERVIVLDGGRVKADGTPQEVLETPVQEMLAQIAGFENFFDGSVLDRHEHAGTMQCRLSNSGVSLEVPLSRGAIGAPVRIAIRAGDILLATQEPHGISARNVIPGHLTSLRPEGATVVAAVEAGQRFIVHLTPGACESLHLAAGDAVWLIIKTHSCRLVSP